MKQCIYLFLLIIAPVLFNKANAQNISNEGSDFWIPFPTHDPSRDGPEANINIFVTSKSASRVTVSCGAGYSETKNIPANTAVSFSVTRSAAYISTSDANTLLTNRAIHVVTGAGQPKVAVYAHIFAGARSAASLIMPVEALGQQYYSMNFKENNIGRSFLVLIATEDNTHLLLHEPSGNTLKIELPKAGDVYEYLAPPSVDLTGVLVEVDPQLSACQKFAAFSGITSIAIGCNTSRDPLYQQLYSTNNWGKNYGIVPFFNRFHILRILAQEDQTQVNVNGNVITLNKGEFYESPTLSEAGFVSADKLISVAQYALTQDCSSDGPAIGDPEMVLLNPVEFNIKKITVFSSSLQQIQEKYINVFMKTDKVSSFRVNGNVPTNGTWQVLAINPTYSYIQIAVNETSLALSANDGFNAIAYGFGPFESYGYSAGTSLASSSFLTVVNKTTGTEGTGACLNEPVDFKFTLPYEVSKITFKVGDSPSDLFTYQNPVATISTLNGETLYTYSAQTDKTYTTIGTKNISILATLNASSSVCSINDIEFNYEVFVYPKPVVDFAFDNVRCSRKVVSFIDKSSSQVAGRPIGKWIWDFGDNSPTVDEQNPTHVYANAGTYTVKLFAGTDEGCASEVKEIQITIIETPIASFTSPSNRCVNRPLVFVNQSTIQDGSIVKYTWDFNDGTLPESGTNLSHTFAKSGEFQVKLTVESANGCTDTFTQKILINDLPLVSFELPSICSEEIGVFKNTSTNADGSSDNLLYSWDFGDPASGRLNFSNEKDGKHKFPGLGPYLVKLTVTDKNGCAVINESKPFFVNGSSPVASFKSPQSSCSNLSFSVENTSTVNFGQLTKVEWYLDNVLQLTDDSPTFGEIYTINPPLIVTSKQAEIKLIAYSGSVNSVCKDEIIQPIILFAKPTVSFGEVASVCENQPPFLLTANEINGLPGTGVFTGKGVTENGEFNPRVAKAGRSQITYTFTTGSGCMDQKTIEIEVYALPEVDAGIDFTVLPGGEKKMEATATGSGLTFKWSPTIGLSDSFALNPIVAPERDTRYTLTVTSLSGCVEVSDVNVYVNQSVVVPNAFTPNGDGINDFWNVRYLDSYPKGTVEIFDRSGQRIFFSRGYPIPFDGSYRGAPLPVGTYYYVISPNNGRTRLSGDVTIIR